MQPRTISSPKGRHGQTYGGMRSAPQPQVLPPDPQAMLYMQQQVRSRSWLPRPSLLVLIIAGGITAEFAAPNAYKPSGVAGNAAANFYGAIMDESNRKALDLAEQQPYSDALGYRESQESHWRGLCAASQYLDPQIAAYCLAMTNAYFQEALPPARAYRDVYQGRR